MTYSIIACDPDTGEVGGAVASKCRDAGSLVLHAEPGVGAFVTQYAHRPEWGPLAMALLKTREPLDVLSEILKTETDPVSRGYRQIAAVDCSGRAAAHGIHNAGPAMWYGTITGVGYSCQGNTLARREVLPAMAKAFEECPGTLAQRLLAAMVAGRDAGGDVRGEGSARLLVCPGVDFSAETVEGVRRGSGVL